MPITTDLRRLAFALLAGCAVAFVSLSASITAGSLTPAMAQMSDDMQAALESYGSWQPHPRYGQVWTPAGVPRGWHPYENGHWVYTDDWGWYWLSDETEEDWGWVTYHYGRWAFERRLGWFWVPGDEWAPAWVDWRYGDDYVGWAALPPDDVVDSYDADPAPWVFVQSRYMTAPRLRSYFVTPDRRAFALRSTRLVNRTVAVHGARLAVNPGISPAFVARVTRAALPSYRVRPRVFGSTQGVSGAVQIKATDLRGARAGGANGRGRINAVQVQRTTTLIQPAAPTAAKPEALSKGSAGQLGTHPPRAAQGAAGGNSQQQQQQQQQQLPPPKTTAPTPPAGAPPAASPLGSEPVGRPATPPPPPPPPPQIGPPPSAAPPAPSPPPAAGNPPVVHPVEPPQSRPERPIAPQTPPPPPPPQLAPRQPSSAPPVSQPPPPPHPVAPPPVVHQPSPPPPPPPPAAKQAPPPPPPVVRQTPPPPPPPPPAARPAPPPPPPAAPKQAPPPPKPADKPPEVPK